MKTNYMIVAKCDPYNAKHHWHGQRVLKYDGPTPVEWVAGEFDTEEEAKDQLHDWCLAECDDFIDLANEGEVIDWCRGWLDDWETEPVRNMLNAIAADGYGIYDQTNCAFIMGVDDWYYSFDSMTYSIETSDYGED